MNIHWEDCCWSWSPSTLATWCKELTHWKRPWRWERLKTKGERGSRDEMAGWHHQLNGHEFKPTPGDGGGQGSLECCSPQGWKESDTTEQVNSNKKWVRMLHRNGFSGLKFWSCGSNRACPCKLHLAGSSLPSSLFRSCLLFCAASV